MPKDLILGVQGSLWDPFWVPFGRSWVPLGAPVCARVLPGSPGCSWVLLGAPGCSQVPLVLLGAPTRSCVPTVVFIVFSFVISMIFDMPWLISLRLFSLLSWFSLCFLLPLSLYIK